MECYNKSNQKNNWEQDDIESHYSQCKIKGNYEKDWVDELQKQFFTFQELYYKFHKKWKDNEKYRKFVEHIFEHRHKLNLNVDLPLEKWVMCKICNKTFEQIRDEELNEVFKRNGGEK